MANTNNTNIDKNSSAINAEILINILRIICMLEKKLEQIARRNYHNRNQYPNIFFEIESMLALARSWIKTYGLFSNLPIFNILLSIYLKKVSVLIEELILNNTPSNGKKGIKRELLTKERKRFEKSVNNMLEHIGTYLLQLKTMEIGTEIEIAAALGLINAFKKHCAQEYEKEIVKRVSGRGDKSFIFPWPDPQDYLSLVDDPKRFKTEVVEKLKSNIHTTGHKTGCSCNGKYWLKGFRSSERKPVMKGGKQHKFPIRMVQCSECGQRFSLLPSFLPREKHFEIDIIGRIVRGIVLFGKSINSALHDFKLTGSELKSKQTIFNWIRWFGALHPATILSGAGIKGSGYLQEDEGFEKESGMRTYTVAMVDPENFLVWHLDYVDNVDEETLTDSFERFVEMIDFKIIGVTKDKWRPATSALRNVCHALWIGFCHLHCLKKLRKALSKYQKESGITLKEVGKLYNKFKNVLDTATSKANLKSKIGFLTDDAFSYPPIRKIIDQVIKDGVHYTCNKSRKGIKKTTSIVDNFLKGVKRKLRQVESFRDKECTGLLFNAMANIRNFAPFMSGAKNAHKSPFMIAQGETYDLPWVQVMNVNNAFLFTENVI